MRVMPTLREIQQQIDALPDRYVFYTSKEIRYLHALPELGAEPKKAMAQTQKIFGQTVPL